MASNSLCTLPGYGVPDAPAASGSPGGRVKVAHVANIDWFLRYFLLNQLRSLQDAGYEVVGISAPGPEVKALEAAGIRHIPVAMTRNFTPGADLLSLWRLYRVMRREGFTVVHTHNPKPGLLGQLAARMAGVPVVVNTVHGFFFHDGMPAFRRRFYVRTEKIASRCSDVILSQNGEDIETAIREGISTPDRMRYLGNGIDVRKFDRSALAPDAAAATRRALGLPERAPVVGFVGRLVAEKGVRELLAAARLVLRRVPEARFLFVGPVDKEKRDALTPDVAGDFEVADACLFTGLRQDMPELYAAMDVFVLPSYREGFPRTLMEASALSVPCVATDVRGCREAVEQGGNGLLVPLGDVEALAGAILQVITNPGLAAHLGRQGRQLALERFDEQLVFDKVKTEYLRLLQANGLSATSAAALTLDPTP